MAVRTESRKLPPLPARSPRRRAALRPAGLALGVVALVLIVLVSLAVGSRPVSPGTAVEAFASYDAADPDQLVVREVRGPRTVIGVMVGVALGLAGALMQGLTRNPLADPGLLGVTAGAALGLAVAVLGFGVASLEGSVWFAFAGAAAGVLTVYGVASLGRDGATPVKLAIAGAAVTALLSSLTSLLVLRDLESLNAMRFWLVGSIADRGSAVAVQGWPFVLAGVVVALSCGRVLDALALGSDLARGLGQRVGRARLRIGFAVVLLAGSATAIAGPILFVGLVVPHVARAITGPDNRWVLAYCLVLGPLMLLTADIAGRVVAAPGELGVSVVSVLVGGPLFIALVRRRTRAGL